MMNPIAFIENINGPELILIFLVILLLFGAERLPGLFRSFGQSVREFKKATKGIEEDIRSAMDVDTETVTARPAAKPAAQAVPTVEASADSAMSSEAVEAKKTAAAPAEVSPE